MAVLSGAIKERLTGKHSPVGNGARGISSWHSHQGKRQVNTRLCNAGWGCSGKGLVARSCQEV